jgi:hypothetical protein
VENDLGALPFATAVPTLIAGTAWAALLRTRRTLQTFPIRVGWVASLPLAILNGSVIGVLVRGTGSFQGHGAWSFEVAVEDCISAAAGGAVVSALALILTLLCFGVPIAWSQKLANKGLVGAEQGEAAVGLVSTLVATAALWVITQLDVHGHGTRLGEPFARLYGVGVAGYAFLWTLSGLGAVSGVLATVLSLGRQHRRKRFVTDVVAGKVAGYRIKESNEGKVLMRVASMGEGYRKTDFEEELYALDKDDGATHALEGQLKVRS